MYDIPPGPKCLKLHAVINLQKVGMPIYLVGLMLYFNNFSDVMCLYSVMHGSYGLLWYLKHIAFPDKTYLQSCTISCAIVCWVTLLGPYMIPAYLLASGQCYYIEGISTDKTLDTNPSIARKYYSLLAYILGVCMTISADCQKNFILKHTKKRPLLITDGLFSRTRNPNYLGEILLYGSFATLTNHWISYAVIGFAFMSIFPARIY